VHKKRLYTDGAGDVSTEAIEVKETIELFFCENISPV
jgi:hypothetical protein